MGKNGPGERGVGKTRVYLIRHGEVEGAGPKRYNGHRNVGLTEQGLEQMRRLGGCLAKLPIAAVYSSDLTRTVKGAEILGGSRNLPLYQRPALREKSFGAWEGLTYEEASGSRRIETHPEGRCRPGDRDSRPRGREPGDSLLGPRTGSSPHLPH